MKKGGFDGASSMRDRGSRRVRLYSPPRPRARPSLFWVSPTEGGFAGDRYARTLAPWTRPCIHKAARPTMGDRASLSGSCKAGLAALPSALPQRQKAGMTRFRPSGPTTTPRAAAGRLTAAAAAVSPPHRRNEGIDAARHPSCRDRSVLPGHSGGPARNAGQQARPCSARVAPRRKRPGSGACGIGATGDEGPVNRSLSSFRDPPYAGCPAGRSMHSIDKDPLLRVGRDTTSIGRQSREAAP